MEAITLYLIFAMLATLWLDITRYTIPNWLVGSLLLLYPLAITLSPHTVDWKMALAGMGIVFIVGNVIYALRIMGGGDIKLITALALWVGWNGLLDFVLLFAIIGGVFSLFVLIGRKIEPYLPLKSSIKTPRLFQKNAPIPYGVAIAGAFLKCIWAGSIPVL